MAISPEKLKEIRMKAGFSPDLPPPTAVDPKLGQQRVQDFYKAIGGAPVVEKTKGTKIAEGIGNFIGGTKIAQGVGQAIAERPASVTYRGNDATKKMGTAAALEETDKQNIEIQTNILKRIKEKKARGEDTSRLEGALEDLGFNLEVSASNREDFLNPEKLTNKQVVGDATQLAATLAAGELLKGTTKLATKLPGKVGKGAGIIPGATKGVVAGASAGLIEGSAQGAAQGLKDNEDTREVLSSAVKGGVIGSVAGGVLGGITGGVVGKKVAKKITQQTTHLEAITPKVDDMPTEQYREALRKGKIAEKSAKEPAKYVLSKKEIATANKYKDLLQGKDPVVNINNLANKVDELDTEVGKFLRKNNGIYNTGELRNYLTKALENVDDITISEDRIQKAKTGVIDNFLKSLDKNDMETLWIKRKEFDTLSKAFQGSPTFKKEMSRAFRNAIQDFIADKTPNNTYKTFMKDMSELINLSQGNLEMKAINERKLSGLAKWMKDNPGKTKLIWGALGTLGLGLGAKAVEATID